MKIAYLSPFLSKYAVQHVDGMDDDFVKAVPGRGGINVCYLVEERLRRKQPTVVVTMDPGVAEVTRFRGPYLEYIVCPMRATGKTRDLFRKERMCLKAVVESLNVDLFHVHWTYEYAVALIDAGLQDKALITVHDHSWKALLSTTPLYLPKYLLTRYYVFRKGKYFSAVAPHVSHYVEKCSGRIVHTISNSIPPEVEELSPPQRSAICHGEINVLSISGWGRLKNLKNSIRAFSMFRERFKGARYHLAGQGLAPNGPAEEWAVRHAVSEGLVFHGLLSHGELFALADSCDILLHPSLTEACPNAVLEGMSYGLVVIADKQSGGCPFVLGNAGVLTDASSPDAICSEMIRICSDSDLALSLSQAAHQRAYREFSIARVCRQYERLYYSIYKGDLG
ncbi:glycosyltransferase family 4 protein [Tichowtungia aerotolerans]|uniref:Glycosyltransferase n=1 Tax=Tichowtungia aerotolerans TaxID=2697043 RepID=A0A6P1MDN5_9BACT|nr:glycosyltransferase family 4 protein [Tichowtungia aerotolerans]QHI70188.1 glycosyltransferase [Tichowtungia aerotolerans]